MASQHYTFAWEYTIYGKITVGASMKLLQQSIKPVRLHTQLHFTPFLKASEECCELWHFFGQPLELHTLFSPLISLPLHSYANRN